jgi:hypothetical protein
VVGSCEHGNEPSGSIEGGEFLEQLGEKLLNKNSAPWNWPSITSTSQETGTERVKSSTETFSDISCNYGNKVKNYCVNAVTSLPLISSLSARYEHQLCTPLIEKNAVRRYVCSTFK